MAPSTEPPASPRVTVRSEDPFATPRGERRVDARLRSRFAAPVTIWTAGAAPERAGLTVSSVLVAEGDPAVMLGLIDSLSDVYDFIVERGRFVVHVLHVGDQRLAGLFAGTYPADPFEEVDAVDGAFGPVIAGARHLISCEFLGSTDIGFRELVCGRIERIDLDPGDSSPLLRYRGQYRKLSPER